MPGLEYFQIFNYLRNVTKDLAADDLLLEKVWGGARISPSEGLALYQLPIEELGAFVEDPAGSGKSVGERLELRSFRRSHPRAPIHEQPSHYVEVDPSIVIEVDRLRSLRGRTRQPFAVQRRRQTQTALRNALIGGGGSAIDKLERSLVQQEARRGRERVRIGLALVLIVDIRIFGARVVRKKKVQVAAVGEVGDDVGLAVPPKRRIEAFAEAGNLGVVAAVEYEELGR